MNQKIKIAMLVLICIVISIGLFAQLASIKLKKGRPDLPAWVSDMGYWVVESSLHQPRTHTVLFYSNNNELMYKEKLEGMKLNIEKRKVKMKLKQALETSAIAWQRSKDGLPIEDLGNAIVSTSLR